MDNPFEQPIPQASESIRRIEAFARDLAYGAFRGYWPSEITLGQDGKWNSIRKYQNKSDTTTEENLFLHKWYPYILEITVAPSFSLLVSFGYLEKTGERGEKDTGI